MSFMKRDIRDTNFPKYAVACLFAFAAFCVLFGYFSTRAKAEGPVAGFYIGAHAGASLANTSLNAAGNNLIDGIGSQSDTPVYGLRAGMDLQLPGSIVFIGPFATYTVQDVKSSALNGLLSASLQNSWSVGGRAGVTLGSAKPYVLVAYRQTDMSYSTPGSVLPSSIHGYDLGAGVSIPLDKNLDVGVEGVWTKYSSEDTCGGCGIFSMETSQLSVLAFLNFKFGGPEEAKSPAAKASKIKP